MAETYNFEEMYKIDGTINHKHYYNDDKRKLLLDEFMLSNERLAICDWESCGYGTMDNMRTSLYGIASKLKYPIKIFTRDGDLFVAKIS